MLILMINFGGRGSLKQIVLIITEKLGGAMIIFNNNSLVAKSFLLLILALLPAKLMAADIRPHIRGSGSYRTVVIEGDIVPGDFEHLLE